ncbi:hypothetical protein [Tolypothrix sp. FACHB-123]|uniref:hypothetical protein n=1 Tax=Tolypothrix sp. FACHB-123 TaxID=2692868 RepID=UPI001686B0F8|nr:hypothetical protein [Tolypothrix sp. FACHB-123]
MAPDPRINLAQVSLIQQQTQLPQSLNREPKFIETPQPRFIELPSSPQILKPLFPNIGNQSNQRKAPDIQSMLVLPLHSRAIAIIDALTQSGFDIAKCIRDQITVIAGNQRGGKGTLMAILAILSKALEPNTKIHYFTAGDDIYPFQCHYLVCRLSYPQVDGAKADATVAGDLYQYLREMDNATQNSYTDIILVIDEAVALSDYLTDDQKQWIIRFLFTRANKKGAQIFVVLHGKNLTSWVGTKNTAGFGDTFKTGATFIGCEATSKKLSPLKSISVATGKYFLADPDSFEKSISGGEIGVVPDWLKTEINPATSQPDPARTLLKYFPEIVENIPNFLEVPTPTSPQNNLAETVEQLESMLKLEVAEVEPSVEPELEIDSNFLDRIVELVRQGKSPVSYEAIRKHKSWLRDWNMNNPGRAKLRTALQLLTQSGRIFGDEITGYFLPPKN